MKIIKALTSCALACGILYGLLVWATYNPNSATRVRDSINDVVGEAVDTTVDKADEIAQSLTDKED